MARYPRSAAHTTNPRRIPASRRHCRRVAPSSSSRLSSSFPIRGQPYSSAPSPGQPPTAARASSPATACDRGQREELAAAPGWRRGDTVDEPVGACPGSCCCRQSSRSGCRRLPATTPPRFCRRPPAPATGHVPKLLLTATTTSCCLQAEKMIIKLREESRSMTMSGISCSKRWTASSPPPPPSHPIEAAARAS